MNKPALPTFHLYTAQTALHDLTGIDMGEDQFLEYSQYAIDQIGSNVEWVKMYVTVDSDGEIELPCDIDNVRFVADNEDIYQDWEVTDLGPDAKMMANRRHYRLNFQASKYDDMDSPINFTFSKPRLLRVPESLVNETIYVLAQAPIVDLDDGLPLLYKKQVTAVAWYCAYLKTQRDQFAGIQSGVDLGYLRQKAIMMVMDSRVPETVTDNEIEHVLDAKTSFGRKGYGKPSQLW